MHRIDSLIYTTKLPKKSRLDNSEKKNKVDSIPGENMSTDGTKSIPTPVEVLSNNRDCASSGLGSAPSLPFLSSTASLPSLNFREVHPRFYPSSCCLNVSLEDSIEEDSTSEQPTLYNLQRQIRKLESQLQEARDDLKLKTSIIKLRDYKLDSLKKLNEELQGEKASFINEFQDLVDENVNFKASNDNRNQELKLALESSAAKDRANDQLREELEQCRKQLSDANKELDRVYARRADDTDSELSNGASESPSNLSEAPSRASERNHDVTHQILMANNNGSVQCQRKIQQLEDELEEMKKKLAYEQSIKTDLYENIRGAVICITNRETELQQAKATIASLQQNSQ